MSKLLKYFKKTAIGESPKLGSKSAPIYFNLLPNELFKEVFISNLRLFVNTDKILSPF